MNKIIHPGKLSGNINIPASKSDSQRSILCAALAKGKSVLYNVGKSEDDENMLRTIQELGAVVKCIDQGRRIFEIDGSNAFQGGFKVNCGESGLGIRLLTAVLSAHPHTYIIEGHGSLTTRPMTFYEENLGKLGVSFESLNGLVPLRVQGPIEPKEITVDGSMSSQFISGLLMAMPISGKPAVFHVQDLKSVPYVKMTLETLRQFGIEIETNIDDPVKMKPVPSVNDIYKHVMGITEVDVNSDAMSTMTTFRIKGNQSYQPINYKIESDWSSASYWIVAKILGADLQITGLNPESLQADKQILELGNLQLEKLSKIETLITNEGDPLTEFNFDATHCPDLFPALVSLAVFLPGISKIQGVDRLKHKESDRGEVLKNEFTKLGASIFLDGDEMIIEGKGKLEGGVVSSNHDHRIAMCAGIAAIFAKSTIEIEGAEAVGKSYPEFWEDLERLTVK